MDEKLNPVYITDNDAGVKYTLDFNRESVRFAERQGFKVEEASDFPRTSLENLFFYAFRMYHPTVSREKTNALLAKMEGLSGKLIERLVGLYNQALTANLIKVGDEDYEKNTMVTVEL